MRERLARLHGAMVRTEQGMLVVSLLSLLLLAASQILLRNVFGFGLVWGEALVRVLVLWTAMIGAMLASHRNEHIRIDALTHLLPPAAKPWVQLLMDLLTMGLCLLAAYYTARFVWMESQDGMAIFANVPSWLAALIIPLAFALMALRYLLAALAAWASRRDGPAS